MKTSTLLITLATLFSLGAQAQTATPRIDKREARQEHRIQQGVANGSLTAQETLKLEREQARIEKMEDRAKADGVMTGKERARIEGAQDAASRDIQRKKHNKRHP